MHVVSMTRVTVRFVAVMVTRRISEGPSRQPSIAYASGHQSLVDGTLSLQLLHHSGTVAVSFGVDAESLQHRQPHIAQRRVLRQDEMLAQHVENLPIPIGRPGEAEEIADFIAFLMGPKARFFCGSILFCDGGTDALIRPDAWPAGL